MNPIWNYTLKGSLRHLEIKQLKNLWKEKISIRIREEGEIMAILQKEFKLI
jgi:hypothetical protein